MAISPTATSAREHCCSDTQVVEPPLGLAEARIDRAIAAAALEEVRPMLAQHSQQSKHNMLASDMFEAGWSYLKTTRDCALRPATPLAELPRLSQLLQKVMTALGNEDQLAEFRLSVICRRYSIGQGLALHQDLPEMFEEAIYGCILENTSNQVLQFCRNGRQTSPDMLEVYSIEESPGTCFRQSGPARFEWKHGVERLSSGERFSVTWRWIRRDSPWFKIDAKSSLASL